MRPVFDAAGAVASLDVLSALCTVGRGGASGTATFVGSAGETIRYGFDGGVLVALETPPETSPAEVLIRAGKVQRATYEALTVGDFEDRYAVAAASGVLSKREALWGIKIAAIETLAAILGWTDGTYTFEEGAAEPMQPVFRLAVDHWILELFLRSSDRALVLRKIGATDIPVARVDGFAEGFSALGLTADADAVIEAIDGARTIEQIVKRSRSDEFATLKLLGALMALGLIHPILEAPPQGLPRPAEPREPVAAPPAETDEDLDETLVRDEAATPFEPPAEALPAKIDLDAVAHPRHPPAPLPDDTPAAPPEAAEDEVMPPTPPEPLHLPPPPPDPVPEPEIAAPPRPEPGVEPPLVNVPLFALTSPEESAAEREIDPGPPVEDLPPPKSRSAGWAAALVILIAIGATILVVRRRAGNRPVAPPTSPAASNAAPAPATPPAAVPKPVRQPRAPSEIVVSKEPEVRHTPPVSAKPPTRRAPAGRWGSLAEAGRKTFEHPGTRRYAIQLELACEESTLDKAAAADPGGRRLWIAPFSFRGRGCYRVLWGKYADLASAREGKKGIPEVFLRDGNRPAIVALGKPAGGR